MVRGDGRAEQRAEGREGQAAAISTSTTTSLSPGLGILASPVAAELISVASSADPSGAFLRGAFVSRVFWLVHPSLFCVIPMEPWHEPR